MADSKLIDTNVYLSHWPFRRLILDETLRLVARLQQQGVSQAWAGSFDALLHRDLGAVNARLAELCDSEGQGLLLPFGCVNPTAPDWEEDLRRCAEEYRMKGIRLHPNYHRYSLDDPQCVELLRQAALRKLLVQIAVSMEDVRTQNPICQVKRVDTQPLVVAVDSIVELRLMLLNAFHGSSPKSAEALSSSGRVWFDIATLEGVEGVANLVSAIGPDKVVFGSLAPLFYFESATLKLSESGMADSTIQRIRFTNAQRAIAV